MLVASRFIHRRSRLIAVCAIANLLAATPALALVRGPSGRLASHRARCERGPRTAQSVALGAVQPVRSRRHAGQDLRADVERQDAAVAIPHDAFRGAAVRKHPTVRKGGTSRMVRRWNATRSQRTMACWRRAKVSTRPNASAATGRTAPDTVTKQTRITCGRLGQWSNSIAQPERGDVLQDVEWPRETKNARDEDGHQPGRRVDGRSLCEDVAHVVVTARRGARFRSLGTFPCRLHEGFAYAKEVGAKGVMVIWQADRISITISTLPTRGQGMRIRITSTRFAPKRWHSPAKWPSCTETVTTSNSTSRSMARETACWPTSLGSRRSAHEIRTGSARRSIDPNDPNLFVFEPRIVAANAR